MRPTINNSIILITGGAGFIGSHLADALIAEGAKKIIIIDNLFCGREDNLKSAIDKGAVLYVDDAEIPTSIDYIFEKHNIDIVFNCATKALNYSFINPENAFNTNVKVVMNILEKQRKGLFKTLCHFSTSEVYGTAIYEPMDENHPTNPTTTYAAGKAAADIAVETYVRMFGLDSFIVRPFNNYGPRQNYKGPLAAVIPLTAYKIFCGEKPEIHGSGEQSRDFIFVNDTVNAILKVYPMIKSGESLNISADGQIEIRDVIKRIADLMGYMGEILKKESRSSDVFCHNASSNKLYSLINLKFTPFTEGLRETIEWYKKDFNGDSFDKFD